MLKHEDRERIRALRKGGKTLREIVEGTGFSLPTVQKICLDVEPDEERVAAVSRPLHELIYEGREVANELTHKIAEDRELSQKLASEVNDYKTIISKFVIAELNELVAKKNEYMEEIKKAEDDLHSCMEKSKRMFEKTEQAVRQLELYWDKHF